MTQGHLVKKKNKNKHKTGVQLTSVSPAQGCTGLSDNSCGLKVIFRDEKIEWVHGFDYFIFLFYHCEQTKLMSGLTQKENYNGPNYVGE